MMKIESLKLMMVLGACLCLSACGKKEIDLAPNVSSVKSSSEVSAQSEVLSSSSVQGESSSVSSESRATNETSRSFNFTLKGVDGKTYNLSDYRGKKVYLKFWASWCHYCLEGLNETDQLSGETSDFVVLSVVGPNANNEKNEADFIEWIRTKELAHLPVLLNEGGTLMQQFRIPGFPTSVFFNTKGEPIKMIPGPLPNEVIKNVMKTID